MLGVLEWYVGGCKGDIMLVVLAWYVCGVSMVCWCYVTGIRMVQ